MQTWENKRLILSSGTSNVKNNWMNTLKTAAGLPLAKTPMIDTSLEDANANTPCNKVIIDSNKNSVNDHEIKCKSINKFSANECLKSNRNKNINLEKSDANNNVEKESMFSPESPMVKSFKQLFLNCFYFLFLHSAIKKSPKHQ